MLETKIFHKKDLDLEPVNGMKTIGLVNVSFSDELKVLNWCIYIDWKCSR